MRRPDCPRIWEAEALRDGRLGEAERFSFQRHASDCSTCADEVLALTALRDVMRELPVLQTSPIEHQRLRASVLRQANERMIRSSRSRGATWALATASVVVLCLFAVIGVRYFRRGSILPSAATVDLSAPEFEISTIDAAEWANQSEGSIARVVLTKGTSTIQVHPLSPGQRFLMVLPDGELEVHGTRFVVGVDPQHTTRVEVIEGVVSLRVRGELERVLVAGERWTRPAESAAAEIPMPVAESISTPMRSRPNAGPALKTARATRVARPVSPSRTPSAAATTSGHPMDGVGADSAGSLDPSQPTAQPTAEPNPQASAEPLRSSSASLPSRRFAEAVAAFHDAAYAQAEDRLAQFAHDFPDDARAQDAAFLRAVARSRTGDVKGAAALARDYLRSYPRGLRRTEAERLVGADPTH